MSSRFRREREGALLLALFPALLSALPLAGKTPLGIDHPTLLFKAWHFWTEMLARGRLHGWSHFWAFGFPSDEQVPFGGELWVALFRAATLGQLSWTRTYALAFAGFLIFQAIVAYRFAKSYFGVAAGVIAAWIVALDPGEMLQGGWQWHTIYGVWPVSLAMSFALLALMRVGAVLRSGHGRDVFWGGAWFAAALLTHPVALLMFAVAVPLLVVDRLVFDRAASRANVGAVLGAVAFGLALTAFYWVPFVTRGSETQDLGWLDYPLAEVGRRLVELRTFDNVWPPVHALAILGAVFLVRARRAGSVFVPACGAAVVLLASDWLVRGFHLDRVFPGVIKIEVNRMLLLAKLFWFPLAAHGVVALFRSARGVTLRLAPAMRAVSLGAAVVLVTALSWRGAASFWKTQIEKSIQGEEETPYWDDLQAFFAWSRGERGGAGEHHRIAYQMYRNNHLSTLAPVFNGAPMYKVGYTPAQIFNAFPMTDEMELFEALSVKYVLSEYELANPKLTFERAFGDLRLYRLTSYRPEPFTMLGAGHGELLEFEPERVRIRVMGADGESRLKIHVAKSDRWQATMSGRVVPIGRATVYGAQYPFLMEVPVRDGELVLAYVYRAADWVGFFASLLALPGFLAVRRLARRGIAVPMATRWLERVLAPRAGIAIAAAALVLLIAGRLRGRGGTLPARSIFHLIEGPELTLDGVPCNKEGDLSFRCGERSVRADVVPGAWGVHHCMTAPGARQLRVRTNMDLGSSLAGSYDPSKEGDGAIRVVVEGQDLGAVATRPSYLRQQFLQFDTRAMKGHRGELDISLDGAALHCFDFRIELH